VEAVPLARFPYGTVGIVENDNGMHCSRFTDIESPRSAHVTEGNRGENRGCTTYHPKRLTHLPLLFTHLDFSGLPSRVIARTPAKARKALAIATTQNAFQTAWMDSVSFKK
jgi:hypothetical protein